MTAEHTPGDLLARTTARYETWRTAGPSIAQDAVHDFAAVTLTWHRPDGSPLGAFGVDADLVDVAILRGLLQETETAEIAYLDVTAEGAAFTNRAFEAAGYTTFHALIPTQHGRAAAMMGGESQ
jgi:hypothetical protein